MTYSKSPDQHQKQHPAHSQCSSRCTGKVFPWHCSQCFPSVYTRKEFSPEKAMWFLVKAVIWPPSIHIREHLRTLWASQVSSHPAFQLNTQGSGLHRWQVSLLSTNPQDIRNMFSIAREQIPSYSRPRVSPQAERRHKLFHLKPPGPLVQLWPCLFSHFMYLTHKVSVSNVAVQTSA